MKTAGGIHAYHALVAFLVIVLLECVSVKDEPLLLSNQQSNDDVGGDGDDDDDDDDNDVEENENDDMRSLPRKRSSKTKSSKRSSRKSSKASTKSAILTKLLISAAEKALRKMLKKIIRAGAWWFVLNMVGKEFKLTYPGTMWCGDGDIAKNPDDLGVFQKTDACCRDHDNCPDNIEAGKTKHGLRNTGVFTKSHCDCDLKFYNCLKAVNSPVSLKIGYTYFNVLRPQCFKYEHPAKCAEYIWPLTLKKRCVRYSYDTRKRKKWQWFDNPEF